MKSGIRLAPYPVASCEAALQEKNRVIKNVDTKKKSYAEALSNATHTNIVAFEDPRHKSDQQLKSFEKQKTLDKRVYAMAR